MLSDYYDKEKQPLFEQAKELEEQGQEKEAFFAYLSILGTQHLASQLAQNDPQEYLDLLREQMPKPAPTFVKLIEGDLLLALGQKTAALACFREVAVQIDHFTKQDWQEGMIPDDIYPVEPPMISEHQLRGLELWGLRRLFTKILKPFIIGPGSHRDNWLIRRFIALEAWEEAAGEFERIWQIHQQQALIRQIERGRQLDRLRYNLTERLKNWEAAERQFEAQEPHFKLPPESVSPEKIEQRTLQFAIDYAYFLRQRQQQETSLNVLLTPLCLMNLDKQQYRRSDYLDAELSYKEFIRLAYGAFKEVGQEDKLITVLTQKIAQGQNATRRILARIKYHQGQIDEALALELAYLDHTALDAITLASRRGKVYEEAKKIAEAAECYQQALRAATKQTAVKKKKKEEKSHEERLHGFFFTLVRLYGALGQTDKVLDTTLQQFDFLPKQFNSLSALEKAARQFQEADQSPRFFHWLTQQLSVVTHPHAQANLYWLLGEYEKVLSSFDSQPECFLDFYSTTIAQKLREVNQEQRFLAWMRQTVTSIADEDAQAEFYWILKDYQACAQVLAHKLTYIDDDSHSRRDQYHNWRERLQKFDKPTARLFLEAILKVDPQNVRVQFDWFQLVKNPSVALCIKTYEPLLELEYCRYNRFPFQSDYGESLFDQKRFNDYYDLAYQLMLLYQQSGQWDKLRALGLRIVLQQPPFINPDFDNKRFLRDLNQHFSLLLRYADAVLVDKLELLWSDYPDLPVKRQLARSKYGCFQPATPTTPGWHWPQNLPQGTQLIVSHENVLTLTRDDKYLYAGHPWGIAVYDFHGQGVIRIALETAIFALAASDGDIWAGTPKGLFRLQRDQWIAEYLCLNRDMPKNERKNKPDWYGSMVSTLALDNKQLWIGLHRNIQRLDIRQMTLQAYSKEELKIEKEEEFYLIWPDQDYVWAQGCSGLRCYDRQTDSWEALNYQDNPVHFIVLLDDTLFGYVKVNGDLGYRPCLIDRVSLEITPIFIEQRKRFEDVPYISRGFCYLGTYQNQYVFVVEDIVYVYREKTLRLKRLGDFSERQELMTHIKTDISGFIIENIRWRADETVKFYGEPNDDKILNGAFITSSWTLLLLPDGTRVIGGRYPFSPIYEYDDDLCNLSDRDGDSGGLHFLSPDGGHRRISTEDRTNTMMGDIVFSVVNTHTAEETWLCTNDGISILDVDNQVIGHFSRWDGLADDCVTAGFASEEGIYFSTGWDKKKKVMFDPKTTMFITLSDSEKLTKPVEKALHQAKNKLKKFLKLESEYQQVMPYLGGTIITEQTVNGKTFLCGTRGILLSKPRKRWLAVFKKFPRLTGKPPFVTWKKKRSFLKFPPLKVKFQFKQALPQPDLKKGVEKAVNAQFRNCPADKLLALLEESLQHENPYYRAEAIAALDWRLTELKLEASKEEDEEDEVEDDEAYRGHRAFVRYRKPFHQIDDTFLPVLINATKEADIRVRSTALYVLLSGDNHQKVMPVLREKLADSDSYIRAVATVALAYRGELPPLKYIEEIFQVVQEKDRYYDTLGDYSDFPYGADSPQDHLVNFEVTCHAIAPLANAGVFDLLFQYYPKCYFRFENETSFFHSLGQQLAQYPEVIEPLLSVYPGRSTTREDDYLNKYVQKLFKQVPAQEHILSVLHQSLTSQNRVVRSNAARACGSIGDSSSISPLIHALDLESGLSRASIVWALGELKAKQALPDLIKLYVDIRNDEQQSECGQRGAGYRFSQMSSATYSHYEAPRNLSDVGAQWHELKALSQPALINPQINEELLSPRPIFAAICKIGVEHAQAFYQTLAGETDRDARYEAAIRLAEGDHTYREQNLPILRNLLTHPGFLEVRMEAAVSLLILGDKVAQKYILEWLNSNDKYEIFQKLYRIKAANKLTFARQSLEAMVADQELNDEEYFKKNLRWARQMLAKMNQRLIHPLRKPIIDAELWVPHLPAAEGECLGILEEDTDCITLSLDSRILVSGRCDGRVRAWDLCHGKRLWTSWKKHQGGIKDIAISPDGKYLATASSDTTVRIWSLVKGHCLFCCEGHEGYVEKVSWSPDGHYLASASYPEHTVRIWDAHTGHITSATWSPNGRWLAAAATDKTITIWETQSWTLVHQWKADVHTKFVSHLTWSPNSQLLASSGHSLDKQGIFLWKPMTGRQIAQFQKAGKRHLIYPIWAPNGAFIASCNERDVILFWDIRPYLMVNGEW